MKKKYNAAIVGIGSTEYSMNSGRSVLSLATEACTKAIQDAGMTMQEVDGILTFHVGDSEPTPAVATNLALPKANYALDWFAGGFAASALVGTAALLVDAGIANAVLIYRAMNGRSGLRLGGTGRQLRTGGEWQYRVPYGWLTYGENMAMWCRRHMVEYGTKTEHLGAIAISQRGNALLNEQAIKQKPLTMDEYLSSPMVAEPLRILDMCLESDGACALLVTSADRAKDCRKKPVFVKAAAFIGEAQMGMDWMNSFPGGDITENFTGPLASELYKQAGLGPGDIDVAEIYDCFTHTVLLGLEGLGFCPKGEGGPFAASGAIGLHGSIPVNTQGGMLSEAYIHGVNVIAEAVRQLRGEAGARGVANAKVAVVTSGAWRIGSGLILTS